MRRFLALDRNMFMGTQNPYTIAVYTALSKFTNKVGECYPSRKTISKIAGVCVSTYNKYIKRLIEKGIVTKIKRVRSNGSQTSNLFRVKNSSVLFFVKESILSKKLKPFELSVYLYLCSLKGKNGKCYAAQKEIAKNCGMSVREVNIIVKRLKRKGLISTNVQTRIFDRGNHVLEYTVMGDKDADELKRNDDIKCDYEYIQSNKREIRLKC